MQRQEKGLEPEFKIRNIPTLSLQNMITILVVISSVSIAWGTLSARITHLESLGRQMVLHGQELTNHRVRDAERATELNQKIDDKYGNLKDRMFDDYDHLSSRIIKLEKKIDELLNRESQYPRKSQSTP